MNNKSKLIRVRDLLLDCTFNSSHSRNYYISSKEIDTNDEKIKEAIEILNEVIGGSNPINTKNNDASEFEKRWKALYSSANDITKQYSLSWKNFLMAIGYTKKDEQTTSILLQYLRFSRVPPENKKILTLMKKIELCLSFSNTYWESMIENRNTIAHFENYLEYVCEKNNDTLKNYSVLSIHLKDTQISNNKNKKYVYTISIIYEKKRYKNSISKFLKTLLLEYTINFDFSLVSLLLG